jgi:hypothetical protein
MEKGAGMSDAMTAERLQELALQLPRPTETVRKHWFVDGVQFNKRRLGDPAYNDWTWDTGGDGWARVDFYGHYTPQGEPGDDEIAEFNGKVMVSLVDRRTNNGATVFVETQQDISELY